jgi:hypothetical protein
MVVTDIRRLPFWLAPFMRHWDMTYDEIRQLALGTTDPEACVWVPSGDILRLLDDNKRLERERDAADAQWSAMFARSPRATFARSA